MSLSRCLTWTGRRIWLRSTRDAAPVIGTIVHAFPTPFSRDVVDLAVRLRSGGFTTVSADQQGIDWDFMPEEGRNQHEPKVA